MNIAILCHSFISDYGFSSAHLLRGIASHLSSRHNVTVYEKENNSSFTSAAKEFGKTAISEFFRYYPTPQPQTYIPSVSFLADIVKNKDIVIVHSGSDQLTLGAIAELKKSYPFKALFYDSTGLVNTDPECLKDIPISAYDGVLVSGKSLQQKYLDLNLNSRVWLLRPAVDVNVFHPRKRALEGEVVLNQDWVNRETGDNIEEYFIKPIRELRVKAKVYGVNYPKEFVKLLEAANIEYASWLPSYKTPEVFARYTTAVHIPEKHQTNPTPGVPSIKFLEALSSGVPLLSTPWEDCENLFTAGRDYLMAKDSYEMKHFILEMMNSTLKEVIASHSLKTIHSKHTSKQRVEELEGIFCEVGISDNPISNNSNLVVNG